MAKHQFQTEINQLLHLLIHSLYSHKEIFLRELISNASDAIDKLKYLTISDDSYKNITLDPRIDIEFINEDNDTKIFIRDNGIGMNHDDLIENLGTIASSGTKSFISMLSGDQKKDTSLIGQFGVGFYSTFMVSQRVEVRSKKAGETKAWLWASTGDGEFEITETEFAQEQGTSITLFLNDEGKEYASRWQIESVIKKYSNHIAFPIFLHYDDKKFDDEGKETGSERKEEQINAASALWQRSKSSITDEEYTDFFKSISHSMDEPLLHIHTHAEGTLEYTTLFFVPSKAPFDMFQANYQPGVKLYVNRVFISEDEKELLPVWLRFIRGVIDSSDLPLNVSREILQQNRIMANIRSASIKKILNEFELLAKNDKEKYTTFITEFNRPLKEGLYSDYAYKEQLLELVCFKSSTEEGFTTLADYVNRMGSEQQSIYYITGGTEQILRGSPLLEAYTNKGIEVLIMDDEIDDLVAPSIGTYKEHDLKAINRASAGDDLKDEKDEKDEQKEKDLEPIIERMKTVLQEKVKDIRISVRLADSPSCIVIDENDPGHQMQAMMKAMGQPVMDIKPILELNPNNSIVQQLSSMEDDGKFADLSNILLEQAMLVEGLSLKEPADFVKRLNRVMTQ